MMTIKEVFNLRSQGHIEAAYEAARAIYSEDKSPYSSTAMFLSAKDMQKLYLDNGQTFEANKIQLALQRLQQHTPEHLLLGCWGEELAVEYLQKKGYTIIERDWHSSHRDIDIIAHNDSTIIFVEVKTRRNRLFTEPEAAVNHQKLRNLQLAINHYINFRKIDSPFRFDVITIVGQVGCINSEINHIEDFHLL